MAGEGIDEPLLLDGLLPAGAGVVVRRSIFYGSGSTGPAQPPLLPEPEQPKPPRSTASLRLKVP